MTATKTVDALRTTIIDTRNVLINLGALIPQVPAVDFEDMRVALGELSAVTEAITTGVSRLYAPDPTEATNAYLNRIVENLTSYADALRQVPSDRVCESIDQLTKSIRDFELGMEIAINGRARQAM